MASATMGKMSKEDFRKQKVGRAASPAQDQETNMLVWELTGPRCSSQGRNSYARNRCRDGQIHQPPHTAWGIRRIARAVESNRLTCVYSSLSEFMAQAPWYMDTGTGPSLKHHKAPEYNADPAKLQGRYRRGVLVRCCCIVIAYVSV